MKKIFILEDDGSMREMLTQYIEKQGYQTEAYASPIEALPKLFTDSVDLIVTDINMPGMDGLRMIETIRSSGITVPAIVISGDLSEEVQERGRALLVRYMIQKPVKDLSLLAAAIADELNGGDSFVTTEGLEDIRSKFFIKLSHEIRTPLTALSLALDGLSDAPASSVGPNDKLLAISRRNIDRLISLVEDDLCVLKNRLFE
jgi:CheY-like chemotaxis protein